MEQDIAQSSIVFHNRARHVFFPLYKEFRHSIASIERQGDENVFQQLRNRYASQLHLRLHNIALDILSQLKNTGNYNKLNQTLSRLIIEYVNEFMQKAKSL